mmetsp:Transcript_8799/g.19916  ORF Transcript_8799/g.19916 Transcript_8799/m.19916 type:complete len:249 (+) Transcript_8799:78-824(+)
MGIAPRRGVVDCGQATLPLLRRRHRRVRQILRTSCSPPKPRPRLRRTPPQRVVNTWSTCHHHRQARARLVTHPERTRPPRPSLLRTRSALRCLARRTTSQYHDHHSHHRTHPHCHAYPLSHSLRAHPLPRGRPEALSSDNTRVERLHRADNTPRRSHNIPYSTHHHSDSTHRTTAQCTTHATARDSHPSFLAARCSRRGRRRTHRWFQSSGNTHPWRNTPGSPRPRRRRRRRRSRGAGSTHRRMDLRT